MSAFLPLLPALAGFACLALAMDRHQPAVAGRVLGPRATSAFRWAGWTALVLAYVAAVDASGWVSGSVGWFGHAAVAATAVVLLLTWRPRAVLFLVLGAPAWACVRPARSSNNHRS